MATTPNPEELLERLRELPHFPTIAARLPAEPAVYLIGGAVRDLLLGEQPDELDLAVEGDVASLADELGDAPPRLHPRFGTATAVLDGGRTIDLARTRRERYPHAGALPEVEPAGLAEDLRRRDFTVNALAVVLNGPEPGALTGFPGALEDLAAGRLRVLHAESFRDDPTRLLRLARYAARLGFGVEPQTRAWAYAARDGGALSTVSPERIAAELRLLAAEPDPVTAFATLRELGLDAALASGYGISDPPRLRRALDLLPDGRPDLLVLGLAAEGAAADAVRLGPEEDVVAAVARAADELAPALAAAGGPAQIAAAAAGAPVEAVAAAGATELPGVAHAARQWLEDLRGVTLEIGGDDLLAAGVPAGPAVGAGLRAALAARLDGRVSGREAELAEAVRVARAHR